MKIGFKLLLILFPKLIYGQINTDKQERFPSVSKDFGILFFTRATDSNYDDIFWIDSKVIDEIRDE